MKKSIIFIIGIIALSTLLFLNIEKYNRNQVPSGNITEEESNQEPSENTTEVESSIENQRKIKLDKFYFLLNAGYDNDEECRVFTKMDGENQFEVLVIFKDQETNTYDADSYSDIMYNDTYYQYTNRSKQICETSAKITGMQEEYLDGFINLYLEKGYKEVE